MEKFILVGTQRTGSSAIAESIATNEKIFCGWEWTQSTAFHKKIKVAEKALNVDFNGLTSKHTDHIKRELKKDTQWIGFRRLFSSSDKWLIHPRYAPALYLDRLCSYKKWLSKNNDIHVVQIIRKNQIEWLKSMYIAKKLNSYIGTTYPKNTKIRIPIKKAIKRLKAKSYVDHELSELRHTNPYLLIEYEKFSLNPIESIKKAYCFFKVDGAETVLNQPRKIKKQSTQTAQNYIINYEELKNEVDRIFPS